MGLMTRFLLLMSFTLLATFTTAGEVSQGGRLLRVTETTDAEERWFTIPLSIKSGITKWKMKARVKSWVTNKRPDEYVLTRLGINGLAGKALTENSNFKIFQKFKVDGWLKEKAVTTTAWKDLKLEGFATTAVQNADGFSTYVKYIMALNGKAKTIDFDQWHNLLGGGSKKELIAKTVILEGFGRSYIDIRIMLGLF